MSMESIRRFIKKEIVLVISLFVAVITMFFIHPDKQYLNYIDLRVLCLLFCLMAVVAGFNACGLFRWLAFKFLSKSNSGKALGIILIMLPFFSSMLITNDVALIIFVPFTLLLLEQIGCKHKAIPILVLQTIAANLGSMATPVGNPQNLFLYAAYELTAKDFFSAMLPLTAVSFIGLMASSLIVLPKRLPGFELDSAVIDSPWKLITYCALFVVCLMTVFRVVPYGITTAAVFALILLIDKRLLVKVDYSLLATFICFFIISGNLSRITSVRDFLHALLNKSTLLTSVSASQFISNVPAAVLLSEFTTQWKPLLEGVNIGGLGTPIASLASLITLKFYIAYPNSKVGKYMAFFLIANLIGLAFLLAFTLIW